MIPIENTPTDLLEKIKSIWLFLGPTLGWIVGFFTKRLHIRYKTRMKVANELKTIFAPLLYWLESEAVTSGLSTAGRLKDSTNDIDRVIRNFSIHLRNRKRQKFRSACEAFYNKAGGKNEKYYGYAMLEKEEAVKEALKNIKSILKFAKP